MAGTTIALLVLLAAALAAALLVARRRRPAIVSVAPLGAAASHWTAAAGADFAQLSEADRCDMVFAVAALEDPQSQRLLAEALDDASEVVALAAARAMARRGFSAELQRYLARPSERSRRIAAALSLFC